MEENNEYINKLIEFVQNRCSDNTLCLDTCNYDKCFEKIYEDSNKIKDYDGCMKVVNNWRTNSALFEGNNIHSIVIQYTAKENIMNKMRSVRPFTHGFNLININNDEFLFCDSWEGIHFMKCRTKIYNYEELYNLLLDILTPNNTIDSIDNFFNDDNKSNWDEDINKLNQLGEWSDTYSSEYILEKLSSNNLFDIKKHIKIEVYKPTIISGKVVNISAGKPKNKKQKKQKNAKTKNTKTKNTKTKIKKQNTKKQKNKKTKK